LAETASLQITKSTLADQPTQVGLVNYADATSVAILWSSLDITKSTIVDQTTQVGLVNFKGSTLVEILCFS
jgi:hypothetical protein